MEKEIWRAVVGYEGLYEVSSLGNIRGVDHYGWSKGHVSKRLFKGKNMKPFIKKGTEYRRIALWNGEKEKKYYVHFLVATAFPEICGEALEGMQVDHLNGCASDNRAINLMFKTKSDNVRNQITYERNYPKWNERLKMANTPEAKEKMVRSKSKAVKCVETGVEYWSRFLASESTGVNHQSIWRCCSGKQEKTITNEGEILHWVFC